jgi:hypothetical protein
MINHFYWLYIAVKSEHGNKVKETKQSREEIHERHTGHTIEEIKIF